MILIACVDDRMGMMFHHRRQSRDREVCRDIQKTCKEQCLYLEAYSVKLFRDIKFDNIREIETGISGDLRGNYFFVEDPQMIKEEAIEKIILYRWNRVYPADQYFPVDPDHWQLTLKEEFSGYSHEKITKEIYERKI